MIIIKNDKSFNNYKCLVIYLSILIILLTIQSSYCSQRINDYIIKNITYGKNKYDVEIELEYNKNKINKEFIVLCKGVNSKNFSIFSY